MNESFNGCLRRRRVVSACAAAGVLSLVDGGLATVASAQGAAPIMEEVVVTARKRGAESIQDIGGSIRCSKATR